MLTSSQMIEDLLNSRFDDTEFRFLSRALISFLDNNIILEYYTNQQKDSCGELLKLDLSKLSKNIIKEAFLPKNALSLVDDFPIKPKDYNKVVLACYSTGSCLSNVHLKVFKDFLASKSLAFPYLPMYEKWKKDFRENLESLSEKNLTSLYNLAFLSCPSVGMFS